MEDFDDLKKKIENEKSFDFSLQEEQIDENILNDNFKKIQSKLISLFEISNGLSKKIKNEKMIMSKKSKEKNKSIEDFNLEMKKIKLLSKQNELSSKGIYDDFRFHDYESIKEEEKIKRCTIENGCLKLPIKNKVDMTRNKFGKYNCEVKINFFNGEIVKEETTDIKSVLTDDEYDFFHQKVSIKNDEENITLKKPYERDVNGAICEIEINFKRNEKISCVEIDKISKYNYDILEILVYENEYDYKKVYEKKENEKQSYDYFSVEFNNIEASKIKILINQKNYEKEIFELTENAELEKKVIYNLENDLFKKEDFLKKKKREGKKEKSIERKVYEYGIKNIRVFYKEYEQKGYFETGKIETKSNINSLFLSADDYIPEIEIEKEKTKIGEINYYILTENNEEEEEWKEIFPILENERIDEKLFFNKYEDVSPEAGEDEKSFSLYANLKFTAASSIVTLKKNFRLIPSEYYSLSSDRKKIFLNEDVYDGNELYILSYEPIYTDKKLFLQDTKSEWYITEDGEVGEFFETTDEDNGVTLKYDPYVDESKYSEYDYGKNEYVKKETKEEDIVVFVDGNKYKNITNYANKNFEKEDLTEESVFYQEGNKIIFGRRSFVEKPKNIDVKYKILNKDVSLRIEISRYIKGYESLTPMVYRYFLGYQRRE